MDNFKDSQMFDFFICPVCRTSSLQKRGGAVFCADKVMQKKGRSNNIVNLNFMLIFF